MKHLLALSTILWVGQVLFAAEPQPVEGNDRRKPTTSGPTAEMFSVVGYLPFYEVKGFDPAVGKYLTDLIYFSIEPTADGELSDRDISRDVIEQLHKMRDEHHTRIEIAIGGWGRAKAMPQVALDPQKRKRFIEALAKYCDDHKLDGVDFDWEFPRGKEQTAAFAATLTECKAALAPHGRLLTIAVSPDQQLPEAAIQAVDRVHLMSYDHGGPEHSTLAQAEADVKQVLARGVPAAKLVLGVPFYGRGPRAKASPSEMSYSRIVGRFHPEASADTAGSYYFNGPDTIRAKTRLAKSQHLSGLMIWEVGQDTGDDSSLLRAIQAETAKR
jgi:chitinase